MLNITKFVVNPFEENTYLVVDSATAHAVVVDPGLQSPEELKAFSNYLKEHQITLDKILLTHMHLDHCFGVNALRRDYGVPVVASAGDAILGVSIVGQATRFGIYMPESEAVRATEEVGQGDVVSFGESELTVLEVPGHTLGGIVFYSKADKVVFSGDSLFKQSIGRTDLPGGNHAQLLESLRTRLLTLPDDTVVLPGHGPATTIGEERRMNPFLRQ